MQYLKFLLAKQGWCLLQSPNSLVAWMLKARYFPITDFLSAQEGSSPSYTWQSILWGQELLLCGLRWWIGDGRLVQIYGDAWIPHCHIFMAQTASRVPMDTKVSTLILISGWWDVPKVYSLFTFMEAETILSIPLVCDNVDRRIWHFTTHERYIVKSGYWVALEY